MKSPEVIEDYVRNKLRACEDAGLRSSLLEFPATVTEVALIERVLSRLFAVKGHDFKSMLRSGATDEEIVDAIARIWGKRADRYSEIRSENTVDLPKVEMSHIGG